MAPSADYSVLLVDDSGQADMSVTVVGDQVVDLTGASPGDVLTVQPDGTVGPDPPGTPGAHAATHASGGTDPVTLAESQVTGLTAALAAKVSASLFDANTILIATTDDTPAALAVGASTIVGRKAAGGIVALTGAEALAITGAAPAANPTFTGAVLVDAGTAAAPAVAFTADADGTGTGVYRAAANTIAFSTNGVGRLFITTTELSFLEAFNVAVGTTTGTKFGTSAGQKLGFYNATPIIQPASAAQAAVNAGAAINITPWGYSEAQANAIVSLVNALRLALVNLGFVKGSA